MGLITLLGVGSPTFQGETIAFMAAAGIPNDGTVYFNATAYQTTGHLLWTYLDTHVKDLKGIGPNNSTFNLLSKCIAIYPYLGGTSTTHKFNLKDPRDLDAAFRLVFSGGFTHDGAGIKGNGTNGYSNTKIIPNTNMSLNDAHLQKVSSSAANGNYEMGVYVAGKYLYIRASAAAGVDNGVNSNATVSLDTNSKRVIISRRSAPTVFAYKAGVSANAASASGALATIEIFLHCIDQDGAPTNYSPAQIIYHSIGLGLTDAEAAAFDICVNAFQVLLNRA